MDLNDDCLAEIFSHLSKFDLFLWRELHSRFIVPAELCFKRNFAKNEFVIGEWSSLWKWRGSGLKRVIDYFGNFINNVCIDRKFLEAIKNESITDSYLAENMANVKRVWIGNVAVDEIAFLSHWTKIEELTIYDLVSIDSGMQWPHLTALNVHRTSDNDNFIQFLKSHKQIRKIDVKGKHSADDEKLVEAIACNLRNLDSLNIGDMSPKQTNTLLICGLTNLEHLVMQIDGNIEQFKVLQNLKHFEVRNKISRQNLLDLVEFVPSLRRIELNCEVSPAFTRKAVDDLVKRRTMSSHCEIEQLLIISPLDRMRDEGKQESPLIDTLQNKYVSCFYFNCDEDNALLAGRLFDVDFHVIITQNHSNIFTIRIS